MIQHLADPEKFKVKVQQWASTFEVCCILNSNSYSDPYSKLDFAVAAGADDLIEANAFAEIELFQTQYRDKWVFGGFSYDLKNDIESLSSQNPDFVKFPPAFFFVPKHVLILKGNRLEIISEIAEIIWQNINETELISINANTTIKIQQRFNKAAYINTVENIIHQISIGNIYETNFCMEFYALQADIHPLSTYQQLNRHSPTPFSNYFKWFDKHIISATPERFLAKRGEKLVSQPIKGTAKRGKTNEEDAQIVKHLKESSKEQQENVMIVDLVRNDLTKSAVEGSVKVEELFGVYTFKQVHHLISTVVCNKTPEISNVSVVKNTFPMGSMTGAPKIKAMKLMEQFERTKRGMYAGAVGYFSPDGDFDFNVIIRTILYNETEKYLSFQVGSAITYYAIPEQEYEECLLKVKAILEVLA
ncbi:MAG TPA: anthranilate synthase component I family protein [Pelobium sp.]|nr:anthranilate synthase component I family protein [Pelobium sp.]